MFRDFFQSIKEIQIISIYNEVGNWIILFISALYVGFLAKSHQYHQQSDQMSN